MFMFVYLTSLILLLLFLFFIIPFPLTLPSGMLSEVDLAAQHVVIMLAYINYMVCLDNLRIFILLYKSHHYPFHDCAVFIISILIFQIPLGMQGAACVRVGNALGAGETAAAIITCKVSLISSGKTHLI